MDLDLALRRGGDPAEELQERAFAGSVLSDNAEGLAFVDRQSARGLHVFRGLPGASGFLALAHPLAASLDPLFDIALQRLGRDLAEPVGFPDPRDADRDFSLVFFHLLKPYP